MQRHMALGVSMSTPTGMVPVRHDAYTFHEVP